MLFKQTMTVVLVLSLMFSFTFTESLLHAANNQFETQDNFFKWLSIGSVIAGTAAGIALMGPIGIIAGPIIGAAAVSLTCLMFSVNPMYHWGRLFNFDNRFTQHRSMHRAFRNAPSSSAEVAEPADTQVDPQISLEQAEAAYQEAYQNYVQAMNSGDQTNIEQTAANLRNAQQIRDRLR